MNNKFKYLFRGALLAFAVVALAAAGRSVASTYSGTGNLWSGPQFYEHDVNFNEGVINTPVTATEAFTASLTENKYDLDSTAGAFLVSLPSSATSAPADGQCWEFSLQVANGAVSFSPSAVGDLLDASQAAYAGVDAVGDSVKICYDSGTTNYYFQNRYIH